MDLASPLVAYKAVSWALNQEVHPCTSPYVWPSTRCAAMRLVILPVGGAMWRPIYPWPKGQCTSAHVHTRRLTAVSWALNQKVDPSLSTLHARAHWYTVRKQPR